ncbi:MAG: hypothetical protein C0501_23695 [Isosphaera sp.]|nr:hypothetical protein [Isosphaera sp.]
MAPADEQPFLDAVFARYHDDGPRLVYADYLAEAGDPDRADLVRVQLALARLPDDHPRRPDLVDRQAELLAAHADRWTAPLRHLADGVEFRRGVPDSVSVHAAAFLSAGDELFRRARVRRLRLLDAAREMPRLIASPLLARVRELDLCGNDLGNGGVNLLVRSPFLKQVQALDLGFDGLDDAGANALARADTLPGLAALALNDNGRITADGLRALADSPFLAGLTSLDVSGNDIDETGLEPVTAGKAFPRLHTLRLRGNPVGDAGVAALFGSTLFRRMLDRSPRLDLRETGVGPDAAARLAGCPALARCTALDLGSNYVGDAGLAALAASPHLGAVRSLRLARNGITDAGVAAAWDALRRLLPGLRTLDLSGNRLTQHGIAVLRAARGGSGATIDTSGNVQASAGGEVPIRVGEVVPDVLRGVADAARLRRRVAHPAARRDPPG